jgi:hypothetical protein
VNGVRYSKDSSKAGASTKPSRRCRHNSWGKEQQQERQQEQQQEHSKSNSKSNSKSGIVMSPSKSTSAYSAGPPAKKPKKLRGRIPRQGWHPLRDHPDEQDEASSSWLAHLLDLETFVLTLFCCSISGLPLLRDAYSGPVVLSQVSQISAFIGSRNVCFNLVLLLDFQDCLSSVTHNSIRPRRHSGPVGIQAPLAFRPRWFISSESDKCIYWI